jgi:hypothetical protein
VTYSITITVTNDVGTSSTATTVLSFLPQSFPTISLGTTFTKYDPASRIILTATVGVVDNAALLQWSGTNLDVATIARSSTYTNVDIGTRTFQLVIPI